MASQHEAHPFYFQKNITKNASRGLVYARGRERSGTTKIMHHHHHHIKMCVHSCFAMQTTLAVAMH